MLKQWKGFIVALVALWILFIWSIIAVELVLLNSTVWIVVGSVSALLLILLNGYFIYYYNKNKRKIKEMQMQYIETLKPDKPLRFCPSDEELIKKHREQENAVSEKKMIEQESSIIDENTQEEDNELENL